jgi:hypothetical protein
MADLEQLVLSISADTRQMQRALQRLVGDTQQAADSVDKAFSAAPPKIDNVAKSLGKTQAATANLAAQFQDIAVQLQGGSSPLTVALQQGTQISQVIGQQGATGAVSLLGSAFASLLSPVSLATVGVIALGGAAVQYGLKALGAVNNLDEEIKKHEELLKSLKDAWGDVGKGVQISAKESSDVLKALLNISTDKLQKDFDRLAKSAASPGQQMAQFVDEFGRVIDTGADKFAPFRKAIDDFNGSVRAGKPDVAAFRQAISEIINNSADQSVRALGGELLEASKNAGELANNLRATADAGKQLSVAALAAAAINKSFGDAIDKLKSTVTPNLDDREKIMKNYTDAMKSANSDDKQLAAMAERDNQLAILSANERKKAAEEAAGAAEAAQKRFDAALNSTSRRTASVQGEIEAIGKGAGELARLETQYRLTEQAQQSFGKVTPEVAAGIGKVASAAGIAADALSKAKVASQIDFGNKTAFLSDQDVKIAQQLASIYGNDVASALNSSYAAAITLNDALRGTSAALSNDLTSGLTDIVSGSKSAKDGVKDMAASIIRDMEQIIIKLTVVGPLMRALQTGFNSLGIGNLLGGGTSSAVGNPTVIGSLFAEGGYTGRGGKYQAAGLVHKGEVVWSQRDVARAGGVGAVEGMRLRGYADGGVVAPSFPSVPRGPGAPTNNIYIQGAPSQPSVSTKPNATGGQDISVVFRDAVRTVVNGDLSSGTGLAQSLKQFSSAGAFRGA